MHDGKDAEELNPHETTLLTALCDADMVRIMGQCKLKTLLRMRSMGLAQSFHLLFPPFARGERYTAAGLD